MQKRKEAVHSFIHEGTGALKFELEFWSFGITSRLLFFRKKKSLVAERMLLNTSIRNVINMNVPFKISPFCDITWPMFLKNVIYLPPS